MTCFQYVLVLTLALAARAAAAPAVVVSTPEATGVPAPKAPYWLKAYSTAPFEETLGATLTVKNLDGDLPKVVAAVSAEKGALTQELRAFIASKKDHTQQLMLTVPHERVPALLKRWRRLGDLPVPDDRTTGARLPADEVKAKIDRLMKERVEHAAELAKLPISQEIEDELLEHLLLVEDVARGEGATVRVDLLVRQR
jgi:hypothetical protein